MKFENKYFVTKEMYKEFVYKVICRRFIIQSIVISILAIVMFVLTLGKDHTTAILALVALGLCLIGVLIAPRIAMHNLLYYDKTLHDGKRPQTIVRFDDKITLTEGEQKISISYDQIISYYRLKTCSILMFSNQNGIMIEENSFTKGTVEDFNKFICDKCHIDRIIERY